MDFEGALRRHSTGTLVRSTLPLSQQRANRRKLLLLALFFVSMYLALYLSRAAWLPHIAGFLDVSQPAHVADVIVVLGGGDNGNRAQTAADLYKRKLAAAIILSDLPDSMAGDLRVLRRAGIPQSAIILNTNPTTTWTEADQVFTLLAAHGAKTALIVTDAYHTRRARATYAEVRPDSAIALTFVAATDAFSYSGWWQREPGRGTILSEYVKTAYYFLRYGVRSW